ncbi:NTP transferase domain-containing protein [Candidatus Pelagibacter sp. HIMB1587]|uniref:phosphocholine cytidylyltransferase family protein n=1 Tax=Candidatus Pelagibacter sp. HIMB1587 TaxID=3413354 RepID=UPI003F87516E
MKNSNNLNGLILAAGRGRRLKGIDYPKSLIKINNKKTLIDNIINVFEKNNITNINVITGYKKNKIKIHLKKKNIKYFNNPKWMKSNMVASLLTADKILSKNYTIISYSDIFYSKSAVALLLKNKYDISITSFVNWKKIWKKRFKNPLIDAETFNYDKHLFLTEIGNKPKKMSEIKGQYMGLIGISPTSWKKIKFFIKKETSINVNKISFTELLSKYLRKNPKSIKVLKYKGNFMEIDFKKDFQIKNNLI